MADNKELREALLKCCRRLRLSSNLADKAFAQEGETNQEYLLNLLKSEIEYRDNLRITKYMNAAAFPTLYTKEQYKTEEIVFPDGVTFQSLLGLDFYHKGKNVVMYGSTGTGKTMLSILIGMSACKKGIPVRFYRTAGLINQLVEHKSVILNTNLEFSQWVNILYDQRMTTALIGRLTHHVELILFPGENNRVKESSINAAFTRVSAQKAGR